MEEEDAKKKGKKSRDSVVVPVKHFRADSGGRLLADEHLEGKVKRLRAAARPCLCFSAPGPFPLPLIPLLGGGGALHYFLVVAWRA